MEIDSNSSKQERKTRGAIKAIKIALIALLCLFLILGITLIGINSYLQSNQTKIFEQVEVLNNGSLSFDKASISVFRNFPLATLSLQNVLVKDAQFEQHQKAVLEIEEMSMSLSLLKLLDNQAEIRTLNLKNGHFKIHTDSLGYNSLRSLFKQNKDKKSEVKIKGEKLKINIHNVAFQITNNIHGTNIKGTIDKLKSKLNIGETVTAGSLKMALQVEQMTFLEEQGTFLQNSLIEGNCPIQFQDGFLKFSPSSLYINDEEFLFSGAFNTDGTAHSSITLENAQTQFSKSLSLLPPYRQEVLSVLQSDDPIYTKTIITGNFVPGGNPVVEVYFIADDIDLNIQEYELKNVKTQAHFVNRVYTDERALTEGKNRYRIEFDVLSANFKNFEIVAPESLINFNRQDGMSLQSDLNITGSANSVSDYLNNDQFFFEKGDFELNAQIEGPLRDLKTLLNQSDAKLQLNNIEVVYQSKDVVFPFKSIQLNKSGENAQFKINSHTLTQGNDYQIKGEIQNVSSLLFEQATQRNIQSEVQFSANRLSWSDFVDLFGANGYLKRGSPKTNREKKQTMKETISGIHYNFQPRLSIAVDTLLYQGKVALHNFQTGIHFENAHSLILEQTHFDYEGGKVDFNGKLDIAAPHLTPFTMVLSTQNLNLQKLLPPLDYLGVKLLKNLNNLPQKLNVQIEHAGVLDDQEGLIPNTSKGDIHFEIKDTSAVKGVISYAPDTNLQNPQKGFANTQVHIEGKPLVFNEFFQTDQFFFDEGQFEVDLTYKGDVANMEELLNKSTARFSMKDSEIYYKEVDLILPLSDIQMNLKEDDAHFYFFLRSDSLNQQMRFEGQLNNISELLIGDTGKKIQSTVSVASPKLDWKHFLNYFGEELVYTSGLSTERSTTKVKNTLKGILNTFDPSLQLRVDTFVYSNNFFVKNLVTGMHLIDRSTLVLEQTGFDFLDGSMQVDGQLNLNQTNQTPFNANFTTQELDVAQLLKSLDYLSLPSLQGIEELAGNITMQLDLAGVISETDNRLIPSATVGSIHFDLQDLALKGLAPLDSVTAKVGMQKRFSELRFAPLTNSITIQGQELYIPQMEIQSNAFNMFVEGVLSYGDATNIWISIPLANLKPSKRKDIPEKRGYDATKNKVYVEITSDENGENKFKFHTNKKKFYEQRGISDQYKTDKEASKKRWKKLRKEN